MMEMFEADQAVTQGNSLEILYPGSVQPTGQPTAKPTAKPTQSPVPPTQSPYHPRPYAQCVFVEGNVRSTTYLFELSNKEIRVDGFGLVLLKFKADLVKHTDQCVYKLVWLCGVFFFFETFMLVVQELKLNVDVNLNGQKIDLIRKHLFSGFNVGYECLGTI